MIVDENRFSHSEGIRPLNGLFRDQSRESSETGTLRCGAEWIRTPGTHQLTRQDGLLTDNEVAQGFESIRSASESLNQRFHQKHPRFAGISQSRATGRDRSSVSDIVMKVRQVGQ